MLATHAQPSHTRSSLRAPPPHACTPDHDDDDGLIYIRAVGGVWVLMLVLVGAKGRFHIQSGEVGLEETTHEVGARVPL